MFHGKLKMQIEEHFRKNFVQIFKSQNFLLLVHSSVYFFPRKVFFETVLPKRENGF